MKFINLYNPCISSGMAAFLQCLRIPAREVYKDSYKQKITKTCYSKVESVYFGV